MAQFDFLATYDDSMEILAAILGTGLARAVPDDAFSTPEPAFYKTLTPELLKALIPRRRVFLEMPGASAAPFEFGRWDDGPYRGRYFILTSSGGPFVDFVFPAHYVESKRTKLNFGFLALDPKYYDHRDKLFFPTPAEAKERYKQFIGIVKSHCHRFGPKRHWVGKRAIELIKSNEADVEAPGW